MKSLLVKLFLCNLIISGAAHAKIQTYQPVRGQLNNQTDIVSTDFSIEIVVSCMGRRKPCGRDTKFIVPISTEGSFTTPYINYNYEQRFNNPVVSETCHLLQGQNRWKFDCASLSRDKFQSISVSKLPELNINLKDKDIDIDPWLQDTGVIVNLNMTLNGSKVISEHEIMQKESSVSGEGIIVSSGSNQETVPMTVEYHADYGFEKVQLAKFSFQTKLDKIFIPTYAKSPFLKLKEKGLETRRSMARPSRPSRPSRPVRPTPPTTRPPIVATPVEPTPTTPARPSRPSRPSTSSNGRISFQTGSYHLRRVFRTDGIYNDWKNLDISGNCRNGNLNGTVTIKMAATETNRFRSPTEREVNFQRNVRGICRNEGPRTKVIIILNDVPFYARHTSTTNYLPKLAIVVQDISSQQTVVNIYDDMSRQQIGTGSLFLR